MATLIIRGFPDNERDRLRRQAVASGRSMEAEMREIVAQTRRGAAEWLQKPQDRPGTAPRGFAEPAPRGKAARSSKSEPKPAKKLSTNEAIAKLQLLFAKATKGRKSKKLLSEEFLEERRRMWGEE